MSYQEEVEKRARLFEDCRAELEALKASGASAGKIRAKEDELEWHRENLSRIEEGARIQAEKAEQTRKKQEFEEAVRTLARKLVAPPHEGTLEDAIKRAAAEIFPNSFPEPRKTRDRAEQLRIRARNDAINEKIAGEGWPIPKLAKEVKSRDMAIRRALADQP